MGYGLKIFDTSGNSTILTPKISNIVAAGTLTMSNSLNGDNTYGTDVNLPISNVPVENIAVIAYPVKVYFQGTVIAWYWSSDGSYPFSWYAKSDVTYYTKAADGVMTSFIGGALTTGDSTTFDGMCSAFPLAGWDYIDSTTTVSAVRIWAAMAHIIYDASASAFKTIYSVGDKGVETVDYMVCMKNY